MTTDDVAAIFEGLAVGLHPGLKKSGEEELRQLADLFRRFPTQSVQDYVKFVEGSLDKERTSIPVLFQRIKTAQIGDRSKIEELRKDIDKLKLADLKKLVSAIGQTPARTAEQNRAILHSIIGCPPTPNKPKAQSQTPDPDPDPEFESLRQEFLALQNRVEEFSLDEIRQRFQAIRTYNKSMLERLLKSLGYSHTGSKSHIEKSLLNILERRKVSSEQTRKI